MVVYRHALLVLGLLAFLAKQLPSTMAGYYHLINISFLIWKDGGFDYFFKKIFFLVQERKLLAFY